MGFFKDESLDELAGQGNVAQFISYEPVSGGVPRQRFSRVAGYAPNHQFATLADAIQSLLRASSEKSLNIRSFIPDDPRSKEFVYGLKSADDILQHVNRLAAEGLFLILNETIDVSDGGVSGVVQGGVIEFAPDDTPRCVEKPGVASLPFSSGMNLLEIVYGFRPDLQPNVDERIEFSIHPRNRGWKRNRTLTWEREGGVDAYVLPQMAWPNRFSRHIGDKAYGLLIAHELGCPVPRTLVIGRRVAPFEFGRNTGCTDVWIRTCPVTPQPGLYTTMKGWTDPFALLAKEDPNGTEIMSVLSQAAVQARYSGAAIVSADDGLIVEGRPGEGDRFMLGLDLPEALPATVVADVHAVFDKLAVHLGPVRFEWVHDGSQVWIVQLHHGGTSSSRNVLVPGEADVWKRVDAALPLEQIRAAVSTMDDNVGIILVGDVGLTSHIADVIRKAGRPARLEHAKPS